MAKIELKWCNHCNRETMWVWQCDFLDAEEEGQKEFYLLCLGCNSLEQPNQAEKAPLNAKLGDFKHGLG